MSHHRTTAHLVNYDLVNYVKESSTHKNFKLQILFFTDLNNDLVSQYCSS